MRLAKQHLDIGVFTNRIDAQLAFWQNQVGLPFEEILPTGAGSRQHRHGLNGSVFKLNEVRDPLPVEAPSGYRELVIAREGLTGPRPLTDPDGNRVTLVPPGHEGVAGIGVRLGVTDEAAFDHFYRALGFEPVGDGVYKAGDTLITFARDRTAGRSGAMRGIGYRYLTAQVWDADTEHAALVANGVDVAGEPTSFGTVARIFFVRDPDGNWIEISQRASLTGPLPA